MSSSNSQNYYKRLVKLLHVWLVALPRRAWILAGVGAVMIVIACCLSLVIVRSQGYRLRVSSAAHFSTPPHRVADILAARPNSILVTDKRMLRVLRPTLGTKRHTFELDDCPSANDAVTKNLQKQSIAVLLHVQNNPGPHQCTLAQIVEAYGRPNASTTLSGTLSDPREVLLYYDKGPGASGPLKPVSPPQAPATVVPVSLASLTPPACGGKTILSFVAHEDDDLLFMNPDHQQALRGGQCLRTVFLTAGDDGRSQAYWLAREKGAEAAYDSMTGQSSSLWIERYILVTSHEYIKLASQRGNTNVTLVFINLADGNVPGDGFSRDNHESLAKLASGAIPTLHTVDGQSSYNKNDLADLLVRLMQFYRPDEIDTQAPIDGAPAALDHSDHMTTGQFTAAAFAAYGQPIPLKYYIGYPISQLPQNVSGQDLADKLTTFVAYAQHDTQICARSAGCAAGGAYAIWNARQYIYTPGQPLLAGPPTPPPVVEPTPPTPPSAN